jgi:hypothetical protein
MLKWYQLFTIHHSGYRFSKQKQSRQEEACMIRESIEDKLMLQDEHVGRRDYESRLIKDSRKLTF